MWFPSPRRPHGQAWRFSAGSMPGARRYRDYTHHFRFEGPGAPEHGVSEAMFPGFDATSFSFQYWRSLTGLYDVTGVCVATKGTGSDRIGCLVGVALRLSNHTAVLVYVLRRTENVRYKNVDRPSLLCPLGVESLQGFLSVLDSVNELVNRSHSLDLSLAHSHALITISTTPSIRSRKHAMHFHALAVFLAVSSVSGLALPRDQGVFTTDVEDPSRPTWAGEEATTVYPMAATQDGSVPDASQPFLDVSSWVSSHLEGGPYYRAPSLLVGGRRLTRWPLQEDAVLRRAGLVLARRDVPTARRRRVSSQP